MREVFLFVLAVASLANALRVPTSWKDDPRSVTDIKSDDDGRQSRPSHLNAPYGYIDNSAGYKYGSIPPKKYKVTEERKLQPNFPDANEYKKYLNAHEQFNLNAAKSKLHNLKNNPSHEKQIFKSDKDENDNKKHFMGYENQDANYQKYPNQENNPSKYSSSTTEDNEDLQFQQHVHKTNGEKVNVQKSAGHFERRPSDTNVNKNGYNEHFNNKNIKGNVKYEIYPKKDQTYHKHIGFEAWDHFTRPKTTEEQDVFAKIEEESKNLNPQDNQRNNFPEFPHFYHQKQQILTPTAIHHKIQLENNNNANRYSAHSVHDDADPTRISQNINTDEIDISDIQEKSTRKNKSQNENIDKELSEKNYENKHINISDNSDNKEVEENISQNRGMPSDEEYNNGPNAFQKQIEDDVSSHRSSKVNINEPHEKNIEDRENIPTRPIYPGEGIWAIPGKKHYPYIGQQKKPINLPNEEESIISPKGKSFFEAQSQEFNRQSDSFPETFEKFSLENNLSNSFLKDKPNSNPSFLKNFEVENVFRKSNSEENNNSEISSVPSQPRFRPIINGDTAAREEHKVRNHDDQLNNPKEILKVDYLNDKLIPPHLKEESSAKNYSNNDDANSESTNDDAKDGEEGDDEDEDDSEGDNFVPSRLYTQVRKYETEKHVPESVLEPRLRKVIKDSKIHTVYSEEGYEDSGYDHEGHEKNAENSEGYQEGNLKRDSPDSEDAESSYLHNEQPNDRSFLEGDFSQVATKKVLEVNNDAAAPTKSAVSTNMKIKLIPKSKSKVNYEIMAMKKGNNSKKKNDEDTGHSIMTDVTKHFNNKRHKRATFDPLSTSKQYSEQKSGIDSYNIKSNLVRKKRFTNDFPNIEVDTSFLRLTKFEKIQQEKEDRYPYYNTAPKKLNKNSALRYAEDMKNIPQKVAGEMSFYNQANKMPCTEVQDSINPIPKRIEDGTKDGIDDTNHKEANGPRLSKLGDKIDCFKVKYFGDNPLDSPFFSEEIVDQPDPIFGELETKSKKAKGLTDEIDHEIEHLKRVNHKKKLSSDEQQNANFDQMNKAKQTKGTFKSTYLDEGSKGSETEKQYIHTEIEKSKNEHHMKEVKVKSSNISFMKNNPPAVDSSLLHSDPVYPKVVDKNSENELSIGSNYDSDKHISNAKGTEGNLEPPLALKGNNYNIGEENYEIKNDSYIKAADETKNNKFETTDIKLPDLDGIYINPGYINDQTLASSSDYEYELEDLPTDSKRQAKILDSTIADDRSDESAYLDYIEYEDDGASQMSSTLKETDENINTAPESQPLKVRIVKRRKRPHMHMAMRKNRYVPSLNTKLNPPPPSESNELNPKPTKQTRYKPLSEVFYKDDIKPEEQLNVLADVMNNIKNSSRDMIWEKENRTPLKFPNGDKGRITFNPSQETADDIRTSFYQTSTIRPLRRKPVVFEPNESESINDYQFKISPVNKMNNQVLENFMKHPNSGKSTILVKNHPIPVRLKIFKGLDKSDPQYVNNKEENKIPKHTMNAIPINTYFVSGMKPPLPEKPYIYSDYILNRISMRKNNQRGRRKRSLDEEIENKSFTQTTQKSMNPERFRRSPQRPGYSSFSRQGTTHKSEKMEEEVEDEDDDYVPHRPMNFHYDPETRRIVYHDKPSTTTSAPEYIEVEYDEIEEATHPPKKVTSPRTVFHKDVLNPENGPTLVDFLAKLHSDPSYKSISDPEPTKIPVTSTTTTVSPGKTTPPEFLKFLEMLHNSEGYKTIKDETEKPKKATTSTTTTEAVIVEEEEEEDNEKVIPTNVQNSPGGQFNSNSPIQIFDISEYLPKTKNYSPRTSIDYSKYKTIERSTIKSKVSEDDENVDDEQPSNNRRNYSEGLDVQTENQRNRDDEQETKGSEMSKNTYKHPTNFDNEGNRTIMDSSLKYKTITRNKVRPIYEDDDEDAEIIEDIVSTTVRTTPTTEKVEVTTRARNRGRKRPTTRRPTTTTRPISTTIEIKTTESAEEESVQIYTPATHKPPSRVYPRRQRPKIRLRTTTPTLENDEDEEAIRKTRRTLRKPNETVTKIPPNHKEVYTPIIIEDVIDSDPKIIETQKQPRLVTPDIIRYNRTELREPGKINPRKLEVEVFKQYNVRQRHGGNYIREHDKRRTTPRPTTPASEEKENKEDDYDDKDAVKILFDTDIKEGDDKADASKKKVVIIKDPSKRLYFYAPVK